MNSNALGVAGVTQATGYKGSGEIVKDSAGKPTGSIKEGAQSPVRGFAPQPDKARNLQAMADGMPLLAKLGITSMPNASGDAEPVALFDEFTQAGKLTVRTAIAPSVGPLTEKATLEEWPGMRRKDVGLLLRVAAIS